MKKIGLICEYNPLHNGHVYHFNQVKEQSGGDLFILSLSSSFTQRGDIAILDKFTRANHALKMGVDLILECPTIRSLQEASKFAYFHVKNLSLAGVDEIWIGSELSDESLYEKYNDITSSDEFLAKQKDFIKSGYSLKLSFKKALDYFNLKELKSNDLLGLYYYKAILKINPNIKLKTIKRISNDYRDEKFNDTKIQSASSIRANLKEALNYVPYYVSDDLYNLLDEESLIPFIKYNIATNQNLEKLLEASEGIENKLNEILNKNTLNEIIDTLASKRYSVSKIKRLLVNTLLNITKDDFESSQNEEFIRVLGFNDFGKDLLNTLKNDVTIYTNIKEGINLTLDIEMRISRILDIIYDKSLIKQEQRGPIMIKNAKN